jgi:hypothetical protein
MARARLGRRVMGTEDEFAAEEYRQQRAKGWCPVIVTGLLRLAASCLRRARRQARWPHGKP